MTVIQGLAGSDPSPPDGRARSVPSGYKASGAEPADAWAQGCVQAASDQARVSVFGFPGWELRATVTVCGHGWGPLSKVSVFTL